MTRNQIARQSFCSSNGLKVVVKTLKSDNFELVATCCGVLVNLLGDWERRAPFKELNGPKLLRDVLQRSATEEDWILAGMCCQALWNFLIDSSNVIDSLGEDEADQLAGELADYLGKCLYIIYDNWDEYFFFILSNINFISTSFCSCILFLLIK